ncbi:eukaryotic translation initiation factor 2A-like [Cyprinus carpio]|uniref:Eukaryotic translation initiation factor 2A-like n=1 Tax=Cyprinus carpio TaxID=7962 RepID=A0A9R0AJP7_CYPCA|nr:eukaryotic translation initiation factor 2A-like [Cyprinus carpio]
MQENPQGEVNLQLWDLQTGACIKAFYQKKVTGWCPSWADDESISVRNVNNELHFFENNNFVMCVSKHEEEPPQNMKPGEKQMSKAALKNQKKREVKKAAKQENKPDEAPPPVTDSAPASHVTSSCGDPETDKKIKNLKKKLKAIDELKEQQAAGKVMQKNQLEKMQKEPQLLKELEDLELGL